VDTDEHLKTFGGQSGGASLTGPPGILPPIERHPMVKSEECVAGGTGFGGLGLGLTISKAIVELHGGKIFASSAGPAHGAMFVIELPNVVSSSVERPSSRTDSSNSTSGQSQNIPAHPRILIVDDHVDSVRPMQLFFEANGSSPRGGMHNSSVHETKKITSRY
jgi:hypothetical protein